MRKKNDRSPAPFPAVLSRFPQVLWGGVGGAAWTVQQVLQVRQGTPFSILTYGKGLALLAAVTYLYQRWQAKGFGFLGLFPLIWLALSKGQTWICSPAGSGPWIGLALFLSAEILMILLKEGTRVLAVLGPVWIFQSHFLPGSLLTPLAFLRFPSSWLGPWVRYRGWLASQKNLRFSTWGRGSKAILLWTGWVLSWAFTCLAGFSLVWFLPLTLVPLAFLIAPGEGYKGRERLGWGGALLALGLLIFHGAWRTAVPDFYWAYDFLIERRYLGFLILAWLGLASIPRKGILRSSLFTPFLMVLGLLVWPLPDPKGQEALLLWLLLFSAGPGLESFRVNLMDPSWHGRLVWFLLGLGLLQGAL